MGRPMVYVVKSGWGAGGVYFININLYGLGIVFQQGWITI